jgi:hypothetical protein
MHALIVCTIIWWWSSVVVCRHEGIRVVSCRKCRRCCCGGGCGCYRICSSTAAAVVASSVAVLGSIAVASIATCTPSEHTRYSSKRYVSRYCLLSMDTHTCSVMSGKIWIVLYMVVLFTLHEPERV